MIYQYVLVSLPLLAVVAGCDDRGIELEFHLPIEPEKRIRLEIRIDKHSGGPPRKVAKGKYAIDFSKEGIAVIDSMDLLGRWQKRIIVTPTRRLGMDDFTVTSSNWEMATIKEKLPDGGVHSYTVEQGSKYFMNIQIPEQSQSPDSK